MSRRQTGGKETWRRLRDWDGGQPASERLAGQILRIEDYKSIDPSHPLGGPDGLKDACALKHDVKYIVACHFPRGKQRFGVTKAKFVDDLKGVSDNNAEGIAFVTNQELTLSERRRLIQVACPAKVDLFHLERIASILDSPPCYGIRLEFLDIEMTKEEQIAFFGTWLVQVQSEMRNLLETLNNTNLSGVIPTEKLATFKSMLESIVGVSNSPFAITFPLFPPIDRLRVPLEDLTRFKSMLESMAGSSSPYVLTFTSLLDRLRVPLDELKEFESILSRLVGGSEPFSVVIPYASPIHKLQVPLDSLREYEQILERILRKLRRARSLSEKLPDNE